MIDATRPGDDRDGLLSALVKLDGPARGAFAPVLRRHGAVDLPEPGPAAPQAQELVRRGRSARRRRQAGDAGLDPRDVSFETMRAGGAGGQHVNKTESAVRATHRPSGLVVVAREERSQHMNKRLALARLARLLRDAAAGKQADAERERWAAHDRIERGGAVRTFVGPEFREKG